MERAQTAKASNSRILAAQKSSGDKAAPKKKLVIKHGYDPLDFDGSKTRNLHKAPDNTGLKVLKKAKKKTRRKNTEIKFRKTTYKAKKNYNYEIGRREIDKIIKATKVSTKKRPLTIENFDDIQECVPHFKNFSGVHFKDQIDLKYRDLKEYIFCKAILKEANLKQSNLSKAYLAGADLSCANLAEADLTEANLFRAILINANLSFSTMKVCNLAKANLSNASLKEADMSGANLRGADLSNTDLSGADLSGADLRGANLAGADLTKTNLEGANLLEAITLGAKFDQTKLSGAKIGTRKSNPSQDDPLSKKIFKGINMEETNLDYEDLSGAVFQGGSLAHSSIMNANLSRVDLSGVDLRGAGLQGSNLEESSIVNCDLGKTNLVFPKDNTSIQFDEETNLERAILFGLEINDKDLADKFLSAQTDFAVCHGIEGEYGKHFTDNAEDLVLLENCLDKDSEDHCPNVLNGYHLGASAIQYLLDNDLFYKLDFTGVESEGSFKIDFGEVDLSRKDFSKAKNFALLRMIQTHANPATTSLVLSKKPQKARKTPYKKQPGARNIRAGTLRALINNGFNIKGTPASIIAREQEKRDVLRLLQQERR